MKLVYCRKCQDIFKIGNRRKKYCQCGLSYGRCVDKIKVIIGGEYAVPVGIYNPSFVLALAARPKKGRGVDFKAFVIPEECENVKILR